MRIDVRDSTEIRATILAMRTVDRTIQKMVRQQIKTTATPEWKKGLAERADTRLQHRVLVDTAVVTPSNQNLRIQSATKGRPLSGGFEPKYDWHAAEFGVDRNRQITYTRRKVGGKVHKVTRRIGPGLPARKASGHVFYPTAADMTHRFARLVVQTTVRTIGTALEGKQE